MSDKNSQVARQQEAVNQLLNRGIVFSIIWLGGLGSIYSIYLAAKASRMIRQSGGAVRGTGRVWWCYLVGGFGALLVVSVLIAVLVNNLDLAG